ncbi:MAG: anthranilate synthase component I family protein, partial [Actinobacteria bacterium]
RDFEKLDFSPYIGGPIGYIAYDGGRYIEDLPSFAVDDLKLPDFYFIKPTLVLAHNLETKELFVFLHRQGSENPLAFDEIKNCLEKKDVLEQYKVTGSVRSNLEKKYFLKAVSRIRERIYAGDVYQVNFSQRFVRNFRGESLALYKRLRELNPGPFCAYLKASDFSLLSSSPERLVSLNNKGAQTRPIAGTRRRGKDEMEDDFLSGNLLLDDKERAEHIMLVDLERNDLGKVCRYDSVKVDELMILEKYSHVIHIVSNVCGELYKRKDAFDLLKALFPGGTITGCPKVSCMEIIEELEPTRRGPYTGSLGYFSYNGNIDFNILIRTIVEVAGKVYIQAGAGIVADSKPEREYFETISKAQALFKSWGRTFKEEQWEKMST